MREPLRNLPTLFLALAAAAAPPMLAPVAVRPQVGDPAVLAAIPNLTARAKLLPPGHTQGTFRLNGIVRADRSVVLRWANDQGEMPTEGVLVYRQKVGDDAWKELNPKAPVAFFQTRGLESRLAKLPDSKRETLMSLAYGNLARDPATGRRLAAAPAPAKGAPTRAAELKFARIADQYRALRASGGLAASDLQMLNAHADLDGDAADAYGLVYVDRPGKGAWRYKISVRLPEGGSAEVDCAKTFDPAQPTPVPAPGGLTAQSANGAVLLNWQPAPGDTVAGYNVYRAATAGGSYRRLNATPVKLVAITARDPVATLQGAQARQGVITRELQKTPAAQLTPTRVAQIRAQAADTAEPQPLAAAPAQAIQAALSAGRLFPAGPVKVLAAYTDSIGDPGNTDLVDETTYAYKVVAVDIGGQEGPLDQATLVAGTPKDLQPPATPGCPDLKQAAGARQKLGAALATQRLDPGLTQAGQAVAAKAPRLAVAPVVPLLTVASPQAKPAPMALHPQVAALSLADAKRLRLTRLAGTLPVKELAALGATSVLYSLPDGSAPAADLVWTPSPDADLKLYTVYRAAGAAPLARIATTPTPAWQDTSLQVGLAYTYRVTATDQLGNESPQSPARIVQVCDQALGRKLALAGIQGKVSSTPPLVLGHGFLRPGAGAMATTSLADLSLVKTAKPPPRAGRSVIAAYQAPSVAVRTARPGPERMQGLAATQAGPNAKGLEVAAAEPGAIKVLAHVTTVRPLPVRSFNPMLAPPAPPTLLYVELSWTPPVQGYPLEYSIFEAPQDTRVVTAARGPILARSASLALAKGGAARPTVAALQMARPLPVLAPAAAPAPGHVQTTPALHTLASGTTVAGAWVPAAARSDTLGRLTLLTGPGPFALITPKAVTGTGYTVAFPVDAAQYGGATFYFQVQAHAQEFGRTVDGPVSDPVEVRLPDLVPPPVPAPGSVELLEEAGGAVDVALAWTQTGVPDLAGSLVDRQPMAYRIVDGLAQADGPLGPPQRLTPAAVPGLAYKDIAVPGGFYRYTLHSVDGTGNVSATQDGLDILVPGEPAPDAPKGLVLAGDRLSWQAATHAAGYTVWRSYTGAEGDFDCISPILGAGTTSWDMPAQKKVFLKVVARSPSGMYQSPSDAVAHP